jgi:hypothetical protein
VAPGKFRQVFNNDQITDGDWLIDRANIVFGPDNKWHLFAMVMEASNVWQPTKPGKIIHATSEDIFTGWTYHGVVMSADATYGEIFLLDPFVMVHDGRFYMFYVGSGNLWSGWYDGPEGNNNPWHLGQSAILDPTACIWLFRKMAPIGNESALLMPAVREEYLLRNPSDLHPSLHVLGMNGSCIMHRLLMRPFFPNTPSVIAPAKNLVNWSHRQQALIDWSISDTIESKNFLGKNIPASPWPEHSFFTNPVVLKRGDNWHLVGRTYRQCKPVSLSLPANI